MPRRLWATLAFEPHLSIRLSDTLKTPMEARTSEGFALRGFGEAGAVNWTRTAAKLPFKCQLTDLQSEGWSGLKFGSTTNPLWQTE